MATSGTDVLAEIARIEQQADEMLSRAKAEAKAAERRALDQEAELNAAADQEIEAARADLREEIELSTGQALTQIDVEFRKHEEALETVREHEFGQLVEWAAAEITRRLTQPRPNGD